MKPRTAARLAAAAAILAPPLAKLAAFVKRRLARTAGDDKGNAAVEYAMLLGCIACMIVVPLLIVGHGLNTIVNNAFPSAVTHSALTNAGFTVDCKGQSGMGTGTYTWDAANGATGYNVTVSANLDMSNPFTDQVTGTTDTVGVGGPHDHGDPVYVTVTAVYTSPTDTGAPSEVLTESCPHPGNN